MRCVSLRLCMAARRVLTMASATGFALVPAVPVFGEAPRVLTLGELTTLNDAELGALDIAAVNLACAAGLPGSENLDVAAKLAQLDAWAAYVAYETRRHLYRFEQHPEEYGFSFGQFAMLFLTNTLQEDLGVRYNPQQITPPDDPTGFDFTRSQDLFISGLLDGTGGTCTSMPVLYVAIGRRLGYPLKLVPGVEHLFLRWDDPRTGERFNIEGTSRGFLSHPDEQYINWPRKPVRAEIEGGYLLKSMTPREELAAFLDTRGTCLLHSGRLSDAAKAYRTAVELSPRFLPARHGLELAEGLMKSRDAEADPEVIYQRIQRHQRTDAWRLRAGMPEVRPPSATGVSVLPPIVVDPMPVIPRSPTGPGYGMRPSVRGSAHGWAPGEWGSLNVRAAQPPPGVMPRSRGQEVFERMQRQSDIHSPPSDDLNGDWP